MNATAEQTADLPALQEALVAPDLPSLDLFLTRQMAGQRIQALIKGDGLKAVARRVLDLASPDQSIELAAGATLCRLAAVARSREDEIYELLPTLFTTRPPAIESLPPGDDKFYAAIAVGQSRAEWLTDYCICESLAIDTAEEARRELLSRALLELGSLSAFLRRLESASHAVHQISAIDSRLKRVRRVIGAVLDVAGGWHGDLGREPGPALGDCLAAFIKGTAESAEAEVVAKVVDAAFLTLSRVIERRFSCAFDAESYAVVERAQQAIRMGWHEFLSRSESVAGLRSHLLEAALVLARQNRTDSRIMEVIILAYGSRAQGVAAIQRHFSGAQDADPEVREWWIAGGAAVRGQRTAEHKVGNNEDQQIGSLLIEVESNKDSMEKLSRAVVPFLEISDPVLAATVKSAAAGYSEIAQTARRLARMRKLSKTDLKGERLEYNPLEHEMLGGHQAGVRRVRVVRDGIRKEFGGKIKTLVKPWVQADE